MKIPEKIYLINIDNDLLIDNYVWADEPCPDPEMDKKDAITYMSLQKVQELLEQCIKLPLGFVPSEVVQIFKEEV